MGEQTALCRWPRPVIHIDPAVNFGRPMVSGASVGAIASRVAAGEQVDAVAEDYGLIRGEALLACWWVGMDGPIGWRVLWREWAEGARAALVDGSYDEIPDPPAGEIVW